MDWISSASPYMMLVLLPVIGLIDMSFLNFSWVADHFVYLPLIGLVGLTVLGLETLSKKLGAIARGPLIAVITLVTLLLACSAHSYAALFANAHHAGI